MKVCLTLVVIGLAGYLSVTSFAVAGGGADPKKQAGKFQITTKRADVDVPPEMPLALAGAGLGFNRPLPWRREPSTTPSRLRPL